MGKKSKRKSNKSPPCYHGCITKKEFNSGEHHKILDGFTEKVDVDAIEFIKTHKRYMEDPTFGNFVIAHIADDYLKGKDVDATLLHRLLLLIDIRYDIIPSHEGKDVGPESEYAKKFNKYFRDIQTERGRINCMAREIPCNCMEEKRIEAQSMDKVAMCFGCHGTFLKEKLLRCLGCDHAQYCSEECSKKDWRSHKEWCKQNSVSSTLTPASECCQLRISKHFDDLRNNNDDDVNVDAEEE